MAQEISYTLLKKNVGKYGSAAIKLNMSKVFLCEWPFLEAIMTKMDFLNKFIALIMSCITSIHYSVVVNGEYLWLYYSFERFPTRRSFIPIPFLALQRRFV